MQQRGVRAFSARRRGTAGWRPISIPWRPIGFSTAAYLLLALLANRHVWAQGVGHTIQTSGGADVPEEIWFLAQTPWAIVHGVNPFTNDWLNAPTGLNLMDNTAMPLLGIVGSPITILFGPVATFNVLLDVALCLSAEAFFLAARRFVAWTPAAFVGGLLYGFSPYAVAVGTGHLFLLFTAVPPVILLLLDRFARSPDASARRTGIAVGVCLLVQLLVSTEVLASLGVVAAIGIVVALVVWRSARHDLRRWIGMAATAAAVFVVVGAYPLWVGLAGPQHINGPAQSVTALAGLSTDPLSLVLPTLNQHFTFGHVHLADTLVAERNAHWKVSFQALDENGAYVGAPLLAVLFAGVVLLRRRRIVRFAAATACAALLLSMGSRLHVGGHRTAIPLPFVVLAHLPLLDSTVAVRFLLFFWLFAALLLCLIVESFRERLVTAGASRLAAASGAVALCAVSLLLLLPQWPYKAGSSQVPAWFAADSSGIPVGATVVIYPFASSRNSSPMLWQAAADERFKMPGGYAVFRSASGSATFVSEPSLLQRVFALCSLHRRVEEPAAAIRAQLARWKASDVLVDPAYPGAACATHLVASAFGAPTLRGGMLVWELPHRVRRM